MTEKNYNMFLFTLIRVLIPPVIVLLFIVIEYLFANIIHTSNSMVIFSFVTISIISVIAWLIWLIIEIFRFHKEKRLKLRNINLVVIIFYLTLTIFTYNKFFGDEYMYSQESPCGKYKIDVYTQPFFIAMPGGGGIGSRSATVILKNKWGLTIGKSSEEALYGDLELEWDYDNNILWVARGTGIDLPYSIFYLIWYEYFIIFASICIVVGLIIRFFKTKK